MAVYLLWWEHISCLIEGLIASRRLTQGMNMFSASPAGIASGRHAPKQTEPFEKHRVLGVQEDTQEEINTLHLGKNLAPQVSPLVAFWRTNYVWPTYGPNGLAMTWPTQVLRRPLGGGFRRKPLQYLLLTCGCKSYFQWEMDLDKSHVYHSVLLLYTVHMVKGWPCLLAIESSKCQRSRLSRLIRLMVNPLGKPQRCKNVTMVTACAQSE